MLKVDLMDKVKISTKPGVVAIESRGGVLYEEFTDIEPAEFKVKSRKERKREQEIAWEEFDRGLREKLRRNELGVDPEKEVRKE